MECIDFLWNTFLYDPKTRISACDALNHPLLQRFQKNININNTTFNDTILTSDVPLIDIVIDNNIQQEMTESTTFNIVDDAHVFQEFSSPTLRKQFNFLLELEHTYNFFPFDRENVMNCFRIENTTTTNEDVNRVKDRVNVIDWLIE